MALRVLLADESVTIKKVIQLALQDFAVEVKAVPVGLDVLEVSKSFQPDLVFADILLQKRSGYDVCRDLKKDAHTAAIPVILMWSSFMELDAKQVEACGADGRLEKPFEVEMLRKLVLDLVPRTRSQRLATFLEYPASIAAPLKSEVEAEKAQRLAAAAQNPPINTGLETGPIENTSSIALRNPSFETPPPKPRMPPPLVPTSNKLPLDEAPATTGFVPTIPDRPAPMAASQMTATPASVTPVAATPESAIPTMKTKISTDGPSPLGALPDLQLGALPDLQIDGQPDGQSSPGTSPSSGQGASSWSMDSFEPLDLSPLTLGDDDDSDADTFQPIRLPDSEPLKSTSAVSSFSPLSLEPQETDSDLLDSDKDDDADKWSNSSLDKYRLPPLRPDEALATDEMTPEFSVRQTLQNQNIGRPTYESPVFELDQDQEEVTPTPEPTSRLGIITPSSLEKTEILPPRGSTTGYKADDYRPSASTDDVAEFTLSEADHRNLSNLEIEPVDQSEVTRPSIVRELLRDPDFSYDDETIRQQDKTQVSPDGTIDLGSAGRPAARQPASAQKPSNQVKSPDISANTMPPGLENRVRAEVGAQLEPQLEKMVERIVAELLPKIAEKIIKRELERLLEDS